VLTFCIYILICDRERSRVGSQSSLEWLSRMWRRRRRRKVESDLKYPHGKSRSQLWVHRRSTPHAKQPLAHPAAAAPCVLPCRVARIYLCLSDLFRFL